MAKVRSNFVCQNCGALSQRWLGKCEACNGWNCIVEEQVGSGIGKSTLLIQACASLARKGHRVA